jgi:hypothetical protein
VTPPLPFFLRYTPVGASVNDTKGFARGLYDDGSDLNGGKEATDAVRARAMECAVHIVSPNYIQPHDLVLYDSRHAPYIAAVQCYECVTNATSCTD